VRKKVEQECETVRKDGEEERKIETKKASRQNARARKKARRTPREGDTVYCVLSASFFHERRKKKSFFPKN